MLVTSSQIVVELRAEQVGVDDSGGRTRWHGDQFQEPAVSVGADDQQPFLAVVVVFDQSDGVEPGVLDVGVLEPVLSRGPADLHASRLP